MIKSIGSRREPFWDDYLIDRSRTTAEFKVHQPQLQEAVMVCDRPWEGDGCNYLSIINDNGLYRMYYLGWEMLDPEVKKHTTNEISVCYAESRDGIHWERPELGIREYNGSKKNSIILSSADGRFDNFVVLIDDGPAATPETKYKAAVIDSREHQLWCYTSSDAIHWKKSWMLTDQGRFDSQNIPVWYEERGEYYLFLRSFHKWNNDQGSYENFKDDTGLSLNDYIRDIRVCTSKDFKNWSQPRLLNFDNGIDYPLYTNAAQRYDRIPHMLIGFPSRYVERKEWTPNFDQLAGAKHRMARCKVHPRYGLTTTDCVFMSTRDGERWFRHDEAFIRPGIEREYNWVYGDCYPAANLIETKSGLEHAPNEYSLITFEKHWSQKPAVFRRSTIRKDGFVSMHAGFAPKTVTTGEIIFEGDKMELNFSTSALGYVYVKISAFGGRTIRSCELFGDSLERIVPFDGCLEEFSGIPVTIEFTMSDADIYSMRFFRE